MGYQNRDNRGGGGYGPRRDFGGRKNYGRPQMHSAVCANCGNACEVPFKPTGDRPVYCKDCFSKMGGRSESGGNSNRHENRDNSPRPQQNNQQMEEISAKLDKIIELLTANQAVAQTSSIEPEVKPKKRVSKKKAVEIEIPAEETTE